MSGTDAEFAVGHYERLGDGWLTGTTVVLCPPGTVGGVDQRGGAPGTRETDLLDPRNLVDRVDAVLLTGGSAYGLDAATGVMHWLAEQGRGWPVGSDPAHVVPIVPSAVIFDLHRGRWGNHPDAEFGRLACVAARPVSAQRPPCGTVGAGAGAGVGGLKGGVGWATTQLGETSVAALAVVNAAGSAVHPDTGRLYADLEHTLATPTAAERARLPRGGQPPLNTTLGVVLTDASLDKAQCQKVAGVAQDGLARAVRPAHTMADGDSIFALAAGRTETVGVQAYNELLAAAADTFTHAMRDAVLSATSAGDMPAYLEICPSVRASSPA